MILYFVSQSRKETPQDRRFEDESSYLVGSVQYSTGLSMKYEVHTHCTVNLNWCTVLYDFVISDFRL